MKLILPEYYKKFKCIADRCTDNCCIGWEIDIDEKTLELYNSTEGEMGKRFRQTIKDGSFVLCGERCPFLNDENLCDIICQMGEEALCDICDRHPRYFGWYGDVKEGGVGLCCEEAARLILSEDGFSFYETEIEDEESEEVDSELFVFLVKTRGEILDFLQRKDISFAKKVASILDYADDVQDSVDFSEFSTIPVEIAEDTEGNCDIEGFVSAFYDFEPIDESWTEALDALEGKSPVFNEAFLSNILAYFIWRYYLRAVFDGDAKSKIQFAVISAVMISIMAQDTSVESYVTAAKLYSKEIEYSEENTELLLEMCYTEPAFSPEKLKGLVIL